MNGATRFFRGGSNRGHEGLEEVKAALQCCGVVEMKKIITNPHPSNFVAKSFNDVCSLMS